MVMVLDATADLASSPSKPVVTALPALRGSPVQGTRANRFGAASPTSGLKVPQPPMPMERFPMERLPRISPRTLERLARDPRNYVSTHGASVSFFAAREMAKADAVRASISSRAGSRARARERARGTSLLDRSPIVMQVGIEYGPPILQVPMTTRLVGSPPSPPRQSRRGELGSDSAAHAHAAGSHAAAAGSQSPLPPHATSHDHSQATSRTPSHAASPEPLGTAGHGGGGGQGGGHGGGGHGSHSTSPEPPLYANAADHDQLGIGVYASTSKLVAPAAKWRDAKNNLMAAMKKKGGMLGLLGALKDAQPLELRYATAETPPQTTVTAQTVLSMLGAVPWFRALDNMDLRKLVEKSVVVHFPPGATIVRESSLGSAFYLLLEGLACAKSKRRRIDAALQPGEPFGETALAGLHKLEVRREATVMALRDCWCLKIKASDVGELPIARAEVAKLSKIFLAKLLSTVKWFDKLSPSLLEELGKLMDIERYSSNRIVFEEGATADKMYIVLKGSVGIFKRKAPSILMQEAAAASGGSGGDDGKDGKGAPDLAREQFLAEFSSQSKYPWFGEAALAGGGDGTSHTAPPRGGTAFTFEPTHLLTLRAGAEGKRLLEALPEFARMLNVGAKAYKVTNQLNGTEAGQFRRASKEIS